MTNSVLSHRLAAGTAAVALAFSAAALVPIVQAQLPAAPPPVTSVDAKEYEAAEALFQEGKWPEAMAAFEKFRDKYKMQSPRSIDAHFRLAIAYLQQKPKPMTRESVAVLRKLLENPKFEPAGKEQAQMLIAKAITIEGASMPSQTDIQKGAQGKIFEQAIKEYDTFLTAYPQSKSSDTALFMSGVLLLSIEKYEDAIKRFSLVYQRYAQSPLRMSALMNIGKTFMSQGYGLMGPKKGKPATDEEIKQGLTILEKNALPSLTEAYTKSGDLAIMNEAVYYVGQIQLSRSQNATDPKDGSTLLNGSLEAFRAVRSREEVISAQDEKINALKKAVTLLTPGTPEYLPTKSYYENIIDLETEKKQKFLDEQDQFLGARLAISRIFLFLKKPDECRVLLRYLQGQKEILEKEKDAQASIAAMLCLTYAEQNNLKSTVETYEAFRGAFKGHPEGDNLPLLTANLYLNNNQTDKAAELVAQGKADFGPGAPNPQGGTHTGWRFTVQGTQILIAVYIRTGEYQKASALCEELLSSSDLKPDVEVEILFLKGTVLRAMASAEGKAELADKSVATFQTVRDKFPDSGRAEDAWSEQIAILAGREPAKAQGEMEKYLMKFSGGSGKSENTKENLPIVQFRLGQVLDALNKKDDAIKAYQAVYERYPESEPAPGAFFKIFDIYKERKDYANCKKLMEEFVQKYPKHENVYYAFNNTAEFLFSGVLNTKAGPDGKPLPPSQPTVADIEEGAKKLNEYVDYELSNNLEKKKGDGSLLKIADKWLDRLAKLPPFMVQTPDQKQAWQKSIEGIITAVEKMIKSYPSGDKVSDGLERLVTAQREMLKAQVTDPSKGEAYFRKLVGDASTPELKAKLLFALGAFIQDADPKKAATARAEGFAAVGASNGEPVLSAADWDRRMTDLFESKKHEEIGKGVAQIRTEYKEAKDPEETPLPVQNALSVALFWEAKVLLEQGKSIEAGNLFASLAKKYPKSTKVLEADYGIILGKFKETGKPEDDYIPRLTKIVNNVRDVKTFELPAKALYLIGEIQEAEKDYEAAIATYQKIHTRYASVPSISGDGLWKAGELLKGQANGTIKIRLPAELKAAAEAKAAKAKALKDKEEAEKKKAEGDAAKPAATDAKPGDAKPTDPKAPGVAKSEPAKK